MMPALEILLATLLGYGAAIVVLRRVHAHLRRRWQVRARAFDVAVDQALAVTRIPRARAPHVSEKARLKERGRG